MKKSTLWLRVLALAMALLMTAATFAACATENNEEHEDPTTAETETETEGAETDENGYILDKLGAEVKFDREFRILGVESQKGQYYREDNESDNPVHQSIFARNQTVEERMGVEFKWDFSKGEWGNRGEFLKAVETSCETDPYDGLICYNLVPYMLAYEGYAANLYGDNYLDLTAPWWPQSLLSEILVNDTLYAVSESNDYGLLANMMAIFFNNDLLEKRSIESPYTLVENNEWTIDKLAELVKDLYEDANTNNKVDQNDIFGFANATNAKRDAWFFALGYKYSTVRDGEITFNMDSPDIQTYIDKMVNFYDTKDIKLYDEVQSSLFVQERAYFYSGCVMTANSLKNVESKMHYGVVPLPKLNSQQDRYYTHLSNTYDTWCVPFNVSDIECTTAVIECMASEAYRQVGPMYFETCVKLRYAPDEKLAGMYDLVRDSVTFDLAYLYSCAFPNDSVVPKECVKKCITDPAANSWGSVYATNKDVWNTAFEKIVATYAKTN